MKFTCEYPESGTIPQKVIASLVKKVYEYSTISVEGGDESVFGTNTTSKKPADIWLEKDGTPIKLFEVTVKKIDIKRLDDCIDALDKVGHLDKPVDFICRIPLDTQSLGCNEGFTMSHRGKKFCFVDIASFIHSNTSLISTQQLDELLDDLSKFVSHIDRLETTKSGWIKYSRPDFFFCRAKDFSFALLIQLFKS